MLRHSRCASNYAAIAPLRAETVKHAAHQRTIDSGRTALRGNVNYTAEERGAEKSTNELKGEGGEGCVRMNDKLLLLLLLLLVVVVVVVVVLPPKRAFYFWNENLTVDRLEGDALRGSNWCMVGIKPIPPARRVRCRRLSLCCCIAWKFPS